MCGSRWLFSRHRAFLTVLRRHSSMLSSSQLEANESDGFAWPQRDGLKWPHSALVGVVVDLA